MAAVPTEVVAGNLTILIGNVFFAFRKDKETA